MSLFLADINSDSTSCISQVLYYILLALTIPVNKTKDALLCPWMLSNFPNLSLAHNPETGANRCQSMAEWNKLYSFILGLVSFFFVSSSNVTLRTSNWFRLPLCVFMFVQSWTTRRPGWQRSMLWCTGCLRRTGRCWSCWCNIWLSRLRILQTHLLCMR